jgi:hypothetical protein
MTRGVHPASRTPRGLSPRSDPKVQRRMLVYFNWSGNETWLRVYDGSGALTRRQPTLDGTFTMHPVLPTQRQLDPSEAFKPGAFRFTPPGTSQNNTIHSMSTNEDWTRLYIAGRHSRLFVLRYLGPRAQEVPQSGIWDGNIQR